MTVTAASSPKTPDAEKCGQQDGWSWQLRLWKSRLPVVAFPILVSLHNLAEQRREEGPALTKTLGTLGGLPTEASYAAEFLLLCAIAASTGFLGLPFSVTWWLVLIASSFLQTDLVVGVATVLSLSVLLGWYGVRLFHPHAVMALWGGSRRSSAAPMGTVTLGFWQAWDCVVHLLPGVLMLYWYGLSWSGPGIPAGCLAVVAALPLNIIWLWCMGLGLPWQEGQSWAERRRLWPLGLRLADTNSVYNVEPQLPDEAWRWIYGSHVLACATLVALMTLPRDILYAYGVLVAHGLTLQPFTNAWWVLFLISLFSNSVGPAFRGVTACCGATTAVGWYGAQLLIPYILPSLLGVWFFDPAERWAPARYTERIKKLRESTVAILVLRFGDLCVHFFPTMVAVGLWIQHVSPGVALAALPANLLYLAATRSKRFSDTNRIYQVNPQPEDRVWRFIFGSHLLFCAGATVASSSRVLAAWLSA